MSDIRLEQWADAIDEFPLTGGLEAQLRALVVHAVRAPSSHNSQPWRFGVTNGVLELRADRRRALPVADPQGRELVISCGAALGFLAVAARHFGREAAIDLLPDPADPELAGPADARVRMTMIAGDVVHEEAR